MKALLVGAIAIALGLGFCAWLSRRNSEENIQIVGILLATVVCVAMVVLYLLA